jgi:hypothetical protein
MYITVSILVLFLNVVYKMCQKYNLSYKSIIDFISFTIIVNFSPLDLKLVEKVREELLSQTNENTINGSLH